MLKISFKESSTLTTKFQALLFNNATGAITALAKKLDKSREQIVELQDSLAADWGKLVQGKIVDQIAGGSWLKQPKDLNEAYRARKIKARLDTGILKAKSNSLTTALVVDERGHGTVSIGYVGYGSSPFNQTMTYKEVRARKMTQGELREANFKKTSKGAYTKSSIPLANLAAMLEQGKPSQNLPARPFFGPAIQWATRTLFKDIPSDLYNALLGPGGRRANGARTLYKLGS